MAVGDAITPGRSRAAGGSFPRGKNGRVPLARIDAAHPLVLGSASPRRRELIAMLGVPFVVCTADVNESTRTGETPGEYLERIALAKLDAVRAQTGTLGATGILVADTAVIAPDGGILGKPADADEARAMIERLAGATHEVSTRFLLASPAGTAPPAHAQTVTTRVTFRAVGPEEA
jgi:septum formation protein